MRRFNTIKHLFILAILSSIIVFGLLYLSKLSLNKFGGFSRKFPPHAIKYIKGFNITYNSYYISGITNSYIYLGNGTAALKVLKIDTGLRDTTGYHISFNENIKLKNNAKLTIDSPYFYVTEGVSPMFRFGQIKDFVIKEPSPKVHYFDIAIPLNKNSFIIKSLYKKSRSYVLAKQTFQPNDLKISENILKKQIDGRFDVDGHLKYDQNTHLLIYLYYYRNQFLVLDTMLNLLQTGKTIDTISTAKLKTATISSSNQYTIAAPRTVVNKNCAISENRLFVLSNLRSDNETKEMFDSASVIDVYDLSKKGSYKFSFYIFPHANKKVQSFNVVKNTLYAIQDNYVVKYKLNELYFK